MKNKIWFGLSLLGLSGLLILFTAGMSRLSDREDDSSLTEATATSLETRTNNIIFADYLAQMQDLILNQGLREAEAGSDVETIAKTITVNAVRTLDSEQNARLIEFLEEFSLLRQGMNEVERFQAEGMSIYVGENPKKLFYEADLSGAQLNDVWLSMTNLSYVNFSDGDLSNAKLGSAELVYANFSRADLTRADLGGANLTNANFKDSQLIKTIFHQALLSDTDFTGANIYEVGLWSADLRGTKFANAQLAHVNFNDSDLRDVDFSGATMDVVRFINANLNGANLSHHSPGNKFENTQYPGSFDLTGADLTNTDFSYTDLSRAQVEETQLRSSILCQTRLPRGFTLDPNRDCPQ